MTSMYKDRGELEDNCITILKIALWVDWLQSETLIFLLTFFFFEINLMSLKSYFYFYLMFQKAERTIKTCYRSLG